MTRRTWITRTVIAARRTYGALFGPDRRAAFTGLAGEFDHYRGVPSIYTRIVRMLCWGFCGVCGGPQGTTAKVERGRTGRNRRVRSRSGGRPAD